MINLVTGTHDYFDTTPKKIYKLFTIARNILEKFGYQEIIIPTLEFAELFNKSLGLTSDIVEKEMFIFEDSKKNKIALRPEGTAGVVRAYIYNRLDLKNIFKFYYFLNMFRREKPQQGRYREFFQIGAEYFNNDSVFADFEIISICNKIINEIGIKNSLIKINSIGCLECRAKYRTVLTNFLTTKIEKLCDTCKKRINKNPFRILDCKIDSTQLSSLPKILDYLCESCKEDFKKLQNLLKIQNIEFTIEPYLFRGLDYYSKIVFEIFPSKIHTATQDAIAAGGRYDYLVESLGGKKTPAVGFACGVERLLRFSEIVSEEKQTIFLISLDDQSSAKLLKIQDLLIKNNFYTQTFINKKSLKSQLRLANNLNAPLCIIIGEHEIKNQTVLLKNLKNKTQKEIKEDKILEVLKNEVC